MDQALAKGFILSGDTIKQKAKEFSNSLGIPQKEWLSFSNGWLHCFKKCNHLKQFKCHGEAGSVDVAAIIEACNNLRKTLASFCPSDIYNMDETGLFYRMPPNWSL